jgi:hypothetical protein
MKDTIDETYPPFTADELKPHFTADVNRQVDYYKKSAYRYYKFMDNHPETGGIPITEGRTPRQIEKGKRFWTMTATKNVFDHQSCTNILKQLLMKYSVSARLTSLERNSSSDVLKAMQ